MQPPSSRRLPCPGLTFFSNVSLMVKLTRQVQVSAMSSLITLLQGTGWPLSRWVVLVQSV